MKCIAKCPAKLILFGEHGVNYGSRCISIAIKRYGWLYVDEQENPIDNDDSLGKNPVSEYDGVSKFLLEDSHDVRSNNVIKATDSNSANLYLDLQRFKKVPADQECNGHIFLDIYMGCGLGSSAVMSVLSAAMIRYKQKYKELLNVNKKFTKGNPKFSKGITISLKNGCNCTAPENIFRLCNKMHNEDLDVNLDNIPDTRVGDLSPHNEIEHGNKSMENVEFFKEYKFEVNNPNFRSLRESNLFEADEVLKTAHEFEKTFHLKPSGVDVSTCYTGGMISFLNGKAASMNTKYLKEYKILIYNTNITKDTSLIQSALNKSDSRINNTIFKDMALVSEKAYHLLQRKFSLNELYTLLRQAQDCLVRLGVCPNIVNKEIERVRRLGIESKISGAGNGGHLFTIVDRFTSIDGWVEIDIDPDGFSPMHY